MRTGSAAASAIASAGSGGWVRIADLLEAAHAQALAQERVPAVREVLAGGATAPGHVVNLGHGVPPGTDPQVLTDLVSFVHDQPLEQTPRGGRP